MTMYWTKARIHRVSSALILSFTLGLFLSFFWNSEEGSLKRGDFPDFYSAAVIVHRGLGPQLYSWDLQQRIQQEFWPHLKPGYIPYAYPPYFAVILSGLANFPPAQAKWILTGVMTFFLVFSVYFSRNYAPILKRDPLNTAAFLLWFLPVSSSVVATQNTALSMFLYAAALAGFLQGTKTGDYFSGLCLGLWLFKPHFAVVFFLFFLSARCWNVLYGFLTAVLTYFFIGVRVMGVHWPLLWVRKVGEFAKGNFMVNGDGMISFTGFFRALSSFFHLRTYGQHAAGILGYGLAAGLFLFMMGLFWKAGRLADVPERRKRLQNLFFLAGPAVLLISPHTLFYEVGIIIFSCAPFIRLKDDQDITLLLVFMLLIVLSQFSRDWTSVHPLFFVLLGAFGFVLKGASGSPLGGELGDLSVER